MILLINFIVIFIIIIFYLFKFKKTALSLFIIFFITMYSIGSGVIPNFLLNSLQKNYKNTQISFKQNNIIVLLGAGIQSVGSSVEPSFFSYSRIYKTAEAYNLCIKNSSNCKVLLSGYEAKTYSKSLQKLGIDKNNIVLEVNSKNTFQNAMFTNYIIQKQGFNNVILVSSGYHLKRADLYFKHFGVNGIAYRSDYLQAQKSFIPLAYNFAVLDFALHEYIGISRYYIYNLFNLNPPKIN